MEDVGNGFGFYEEGGGFVVARVIAPGGHG